MFLKARIGKKMNDLGTARRIFIKALFFICLTLLVTSCLEVKQEVNINKDGSGNAKLEIAIQKEMLFDPMAIPNLKNNLNKEGWSILGEVEKEGKHVITAGRRFKDISELNDDESRYTFSSQRKGFMRRSYALKVKYIKSPEIPFPFPYEISIRMPGSIDETNGNKVSSDRSRWNLEGLRKGTELSVKSSGFTISIFGLLVIVMAGFLLFFVGLVIVNKMIKPVIRKNRVVSKVIFCTQCGKENPAAASFCTNCGERVK